MANSGNWQNQAHTSEDQQICPECNGEKMIRGVCTCDMEWRGSSVGEEWNDCRCTPDTPCSYCNGEGVYHP